MAANKCETKGKPIGFAREKSITDCCRLLGDGYEFEGRHYTYGDGNADVLEHQLRLLPHQEMNSQCRWTRGSLLSYFLHELHSKLPALTLMLDTEARRFEGLPVVLDAGDETCLGRLCPGYGKLKGAIGSAHEIEDSKAGARLKHACYLTEDAGLVREVHADMDFVRAIERAGIERQRQPAGLVECDTLVEPYHTSEALRDLNEFRSEIYAGDLAAASCKVAGWTADTTADIQQMHSRSQVHERGQGFGCLACAEVKLIHPAEIVRGELLRILACSSKAVENSIF